MSEHDALARAIKKVGSAAELARKIGTSRQAVTKWNRVPAERVLAVEAATEGGVTRYELRPDIYGKSAEAAA